MEKRFWIVFWSFLAILAVFIGLFFFLEGGAKNQSFKYVKEDSDGKIINEIIISFGKEKDTLDISMNTISSSLNGFDETLVGLNDLGSNITKDSLLKASVFSTCIGAPEILFSENGGLNLESLLEDLDFIGKESNEPEPGFFAAYSVSSLKISLIDEGKTYGKCEYKDRDLVGDIQFKGESFSYDEATEFIGEFFFEIMRLSLQTANQQSSEDE